MPSALPLLLVGGAAVIILGGKKKKKSTSKSLPPTGEVPNDLPTLEGEDEDLDIDPSSSSPTPTPTPTTPALPEPTESNAKPAIGPTGSGSCATSLYSRDPMYITDNVSMAQNSWSLYPEKGYYFYINHDGQKKLYDYMLNRFEAMESGEEVRTVASVVLREALKNFNSDCNWESPIDSLSEPERLVWDGGSRLVNIAQFTAGIEDPGQGDLFQTSQRFTITRNSLGTVDPGFMGVDNAAKQDLIDRRVELLATDTTQENAEHIIGKIRKMSGPNGEPNLFEVEILGTFQGADVAPRLKLKHGFKVGSNAYFSQPGPTGIFRMFPKGME